MRALVLVVAVLACAASARRGGGGHYAAAAACGFSDPDGKTNCMANAHAAAARQQNLEIAEQQAQTAAQQASYEAHAAQTMRYRTYCERIAVTLLQCQVIDPAHASQAVGACVGAMLSPGSKEYGVTLCIEGATLERSCERVSRCLGPPPVTLKQH